VVTPFDTLPHHDVTLNGWRYHYVDAGSGEPVVMVHGNPTWSFLYRNLIAALMDRFRCLAPDHLGCGRSDKPTPERYTYRLRQRIDDLEAWLAQVCPNTAVNLVLHDWGGMIGMGWAVRHPQRVRRIVALNTACFPLPASKRFPWPLWLARSLPVSEFLVRGLNLFCLSAGLVCARWSALLATERFRYRQPYDSWANRVAIYRFVEDIPLRDSDPSFAEVAGIANNLDQLHGVPMLLGWGLRDFVFDRHFLAEWQRRFPHAEVAAFPRAGHFVLDDARAELIPRIRQFLERPLP
jgi:haloalkane dehalogenase